MTIRETSSTAYNIVLTTEIINTETLQKMEENRDENKKLLKQKKSLIIKQISAAKSKVLRYLGNSSSCLLSFKIDVN
jgi:hypothetical protein